MPGNTIKQEYVQKGRKKMLTLKNGVVKENAKVLLIDYLIGAGDVIMASELLIQQIKGAKVVDSFCIFSVPRLNGDKKVMSKLVTIFNLD